MLVILLDITLFSEQFYIEKGILELFLQSLSLLKCSGDVSPFFNYKNCFLNVNHASNTPKFQIF